MISTTSTNLKGMQEYYDIRNQILFKQAENTRLEKTIEQNKTDIEVLKNKLKNVSWHPDTTGLVDINE